MIKILYILIFRILFKKNYNLNKKIFNNFPTDKNV